jgi:hypothetical protein
MYLIGTFTTGFLLKVADETALIQSSHQIGGKHYWSYPADTQVYVFSRPYKTSVGTQVYSGTEVLQSLASDGSDAEHLAYSYETAVFFEQQASSLKFYRDAMA